MVNTGVTENQSKPIKKKIKMKFVGDGGSQRGGWYIPSCYGFTTESYDSIVAFNEKILAVDQRDV